MKFFKILSVAVIMAALAISTGCVSHHTFKNSENKVAMREAVRKADAKAITILNDGGSAADAGVKVPFLDTIGERPALQAGAAIADAALIWGAAEGVQYLTDGGSDNDGGESQDSGRDSITINNNGDGNTIQVRGDENNSDSNNTAE